MQRILYAGSIYRNRYRQKSCQGDEKMVIVLTITGLTGLALLVYLFYVLFRGEEL